MTAGGKSLELEIRRAVYGGFLASMCATVGWLVWLFGQALLKDWTAVLGPIIGAGLGFVVQGLEHYHEVAKFESEGGNWSEQEGEAREDAPRSFWKGLFTKSATLVLLFVVLTCEHVLGDLLKDYLIPFVASVGTLFPVGATFGVALNREWEEISPFQAAARGLAVGVGASLVAALAQWLMTGVVNLGVFGWWIVVGIGLSLGCMTRPLGPLRAAGGIAAAFGLVAFCSLPGVFRWAERLPFVQIREPVEVAAMLASVVLQEPEMPARFWLEAENPKPKPPEAPVPPPIPETDEQRIARLRNTHFETDAERNQRMIREREANFDKERALGWNSTLVRSFIVVLLFGAGLGLAPGLEEALRPDDYPSSRTARNDRVSATIVVVCFALSCVLVRHAQAVVAMLSKTEEHAAKG